MNPSENPVYYIGIYDMTDPNLFKRYARDPDCQEAKGIRQTSTTNVTMVLAAEYAR